MTAGSRPVALVGKGLVFDTGGLSIKPAASMADMKFDKCGASVVLGAMHFFNLFVFSRIRRHKNVLEAPRPVPPDLMLPPLPAEGPRAG